MSCRGTGLGFVISPVVWGVCLEWYGKFGTRAWDIVTKVVGAALAWRLSGAAGEESPVLQGSKEGEVRWGRPGFQHSSPQFLLINPLASLMLLSCSV